MCSRSRCWPGRFRFLDLRLLGVVLKKEPVSQVAEQVLPLTWAGFAVMSISGLMLFASEAVKMYENPAFRVKLILMVLAGLNPLIFHSTVYKSVTAWNETPRPPVRARIAATCSLTLWSAIIVAGRAIAYYH